MATLHLTMAATVADLRKQFNDAFGAQVKIYNGNKVAEPAAKLSELGLKAASDFECRANLTVASFIERMKEEHGLKVKVYTCDEWVAVLDGLTLDSAGKVKKNAVRADMENMIAYQKNHSTEVNAPIEDNSAAEAAKAAAQLAAAKAAEEAARQKADAELARQKAEAEVAQKELERIKAETAKAQAEAAAAKAAAEKAAAEAAKAEQAKAAASAETSAAIGALPGLFSVASNKKVRFSMGNLQFNPKKYEFRFALHQYDRIGMDNTKIAIDYDGWIDLFGYGTSGYMGCEPTETSKKSEEYPDNDIANTNYDWGVYNPISNGGNKEGIWRTLTRDEWHHILTKRPNAEKLRAKACVNGINGTIILPDDFYEHRVRVPFDSTPNDFSDNTYDLTQWATLEAAGAIFLPCGGFRAGTEMRRGPEDTGYYWTSYKGCYIILTTNSAFDDRIYTSMTNVSSLYDGHSVRLVQDVK